MNSAEATEELCAIYVDMGTTNTRVWLVRGNEILARGSKTVGVGDTARDGSTTRIQSGLKELITAMLTPANETSAPNTPEAIVAAGMIGSPLGLAEVPHVSAPAGLRAFIAADLDALVARGILVENIPVVISGNEALAEAWREALRQRSVQAKVLTSAETEEAFLAGVRSILRQVIAGSGSVLT